MKSKRIDKAIEIINYAIQNQITVTEASVKCGFSYTYVKNVKALVYENYGSGNLSAELFNRFAIAYERYQGEDLEWKKLPRKTDNEFTKISDPSKERKNFVGNEKITYTENGNQATVEWKSGANYPSDHIKTLAELLKATEVDLNVWQVKDHSVNKWDVTAIINKLPTTIQNFQVKARLEKDVKLSDALDIEKIFKNMVKTYTPPILNIAPKAFGEQDENNLLEISLFDLHLGKLCWEQETGENFDIKIARKRFIDTVEKLVQRASGFQYNRILFPIGNDFLNSDTIFNTTTKGTPQNEDDVRWQKTFGIATKLLVDAINLLKQTGVPIDVINVAGNHDYERSHYLGAYLEAWFNNDPMVHINNGASPRKYYRFGKVLLGFTHGSEEKESSLPLLMASDIESKPMWSETTYHEWHVGHQHRKRDVKYAILDRAKMTNEDLGVTVRYLSSLTSTDSWHFSHGFVGAIKAGEGFIWNDETGMIAHLNANLVVE